MSSDRFSEEPVPAEQNRYLEPALAGMVTDLENQFAAQRRAQIAGLSADLAQGEAASVQLLDRVRAAVGTHVHVLTNSGQRWDGLLTQAAFDALILQDKGGVQVIVSPAALAVIFPLPQPPARTDKQYPLLGKTLRQLGRSRVLVHIALKAGKISGRISRVGADYVEVTLAVGASQCVPLGVSGARVNLAFTSLETVCAKCG